MKTNQKILLFGAGGMLGRYIKGVLDKKTDIKVFSPSSKECNITKPAEISGIFTKTTPDFIIHAAALCDTQRCEIEKELATAINIHGTETIAENAYKYNIPLLYMGSDYVFDGNKGTPYFEEDPAYPLNHYAYTKMRGEEIARTLSAHYVVRPSVIFGLGKENIVNVIASLSTGSKKLPTDKIRRPTYALDLAEAILNLIKAMPPYGTYHVANKGFCSNYQLGIDVLNFLGKPLSLISPCLIKDLLQSAPVAKTIIIDDSKWTRASLPALRPYQEALQEYLQGELKNQTNKS